MVPRVTCMNRFFHYRTTLQNKEFILKSMLINAKIYFLKNQPESDAPFAFGHLDPHPINPIGEKASFSIYSNQSYLTLTKTTDGFSKLFNKDRASAMSIVDLLQFEQPLSENIVPFTNLKRVYRKTEKYQKLDEQNIELLKSLGYIK